MKNKRQGLHLMGNSQPAICVNQKQFGVCQERSFFESVFPF